MQEIRLFEYIKTNLNIIRDSTNMQSGGQNIYVDCFEENKISKVRFWVKKINLKWNVEKYIANGLQEKASRHCNTSILYTRDLWQYNYLKNLSWNHVTVLNVIFTCKLIIKSSI